MSRVETAAEKSFRSYPLSPSFFISLSQLFFFNLSPCLSSYLLPSLFLSRFLISCLTKSLSSVSMSDDKFTRGETYLVSLSNIYVCDFCEDRGENRSLEISCEALNLNPCDAQGEAFNIHVTREARLSTSSRARREIITSRLADSPTPSSNVVGMFKFGTYL